MAGSGEAAGAAEGATRKGGLFQRRKPKDAQTPYDQGAEPPTSRAPADTAFKQQRLRAWRPILTPRMVLALFIVTGLFFASVGGLVLWASSQVYEVESDDYSKTCCVENCDNDLWALPEGQRRKDANPCAVSVTLDEDMEPPIYMYYKLTNFYQNHRKYISSRDDKLLRGEEAIDPEVTCKFRYECSEECSCDWAGGGCSDGVKMKSRADRQPEAIKPCGLIAWSVFNDSFSLQSADGSQIPLRQKGIAWDTDVDKRFKNAADCSTGMNFPPFRGLRKCLGARSADGLPLDAAGAADAAAGCEPAEDTPAAGATPKCGLCTPGSGYCNEDEHFIVWMRTAGVQPFRKLFARIEQRLPKGTYSLSVSSGFVNASGVYTNADGVEQTFLYPVRSFGGNKYVVLSSTSWMGGKSDFLGFTYAILGGVCLLLALIFGHRNCVLQRRLPLKPEERQ